MALVLLTGASSFSGLWIAESLAAAGHEVVAPLRRAADDYQGLRLERVRRLAAISEVIFDHDFGSPAFLALAAARQWDVLAHHAADIPGYREMTYDVVAGVERNAGGAKDILLRLGGGAVVIVTGTTFEAGEGMSEPLSPAVSPYGLSKGLTNQIWRHLAIWQGRRFGKFVIAAPFGPWEEGRFVWSLFQRWMGNESGVVRTPNYVRDNIPAPLLGLSYARFVARLLEQPGPADLVARPSGIVGSQGDFARRVAAEAAVRLGRPCEVMDALHPYEPEPRRRVNSDPVRDPGWDEPRFWDDYVGYYGELASRGMLGAISA